MRAHLPLALVATVVMLLCPATGAFSLSPRVPAVAQPLLKTDNFYVSDSTTGSVAVLNSSTFSVVANVTTGRLASSHPTGLCYNPINHEIIVADNGGTNKGRISIVDA